MASRRKRRIERRQIYIFVEGHTELKYFEMLKQRLRLSTVKIKSQLLDNSGQNWLEKAQRIMANDPQFRRDSQTQVIVVFDQDEMSLAEFTKIRLMAEKNEIQLGFSNQMFEVWLLAHFEKLGSGIVTRHELAHRISNHLKQDYVKAKASQLDVIVERVAEAIENSRAVAKADYQQQCTTIGPLIKQMML